MKEKELRRSQTSLRGEELVEIHYFEEGVRYVLASNRKEEFRRKRNRNMIENNTGGTWPGHNSRTWSRGGMHGIERNSTSNTTKRGDQRQDIR